MPFFNKICEFSSDSNDLSQYFPPNLSVHKDLPAHWVPWPLVVKNHVEKDFGDDCRRLSFQYHSYKDSACTDVSATGCQKCLKV